MAKLCAVCNEKTDSDDHFSVEGAEGDIEVHTYCLDEFNQHPEKYGGTATTRKEPEIAQEFEPPSPSTMKERFSLTIHWLGTVILMIGLYLYPTVATVIYVQGGVSSDQEIIEILLIAYAAITGIFFLCWWIKWMLTGSTQIWPLKKTHDFWFGWVGFPIICWAFLILIIATTPEG